jgi:hypothetical protein
MLDEEIRGMLGKKSLAFFEGIQKYSDYLEAANRMAIVRLNFNDHGPTHSKIVARNALQMFDILKGHRTPNIMKEGWGDEDDVKVVILGGSFFHDVGNAVHRDGHHIHGVSLAHAFLSEPLSQIYLRPVPILTEILHAVYSHHEPVECLTMEAGIVKVADGTDMEGGRARIPYNRGKMDIHSVSALAIRKVTLAQGPERPLKITVEMSDNAGIFQVQEVLGKKIETSGLKDMIDICAMVSGKEVKISF